MAKVVMGAPFGQPGIIGNTGAVRSRAWIWDFSSTQSTSAFSGGQIQPDDVADLVDELWVVADLERVDQVWLEPERLPDPAHRRLRQPVFGPSTPATSAWRRRAGAPAWPPPPASICSSLIVRGAPGRGSSASPSNRPPQTVAATYTPSAATHPPRRRLPYWICLPHNPTRSDTAAPTPATTSPAAPTAAACHAPHRSTPTPPPACPGRHPPSLHLIS